MKGLVKKIMNIGKKIKAIIGGRRKPSKAELDRLFKYYRFEVMKHEVIDNYLESKVFSELVDLAKFADFGCSTAIQAAFCLGYGKGKDSASNG